MTISRRTLFKQAGAGIGLTLARPGLIASGLLGVDMPAFAAPALANAIEFLQGTLSKTNVVTKLGSVILAETSALNFPISATRLFFSTAYQLQKTMLSTYLGQFSLIGTGNSAGTNGFAISMFPPDTATGSKTEALQLQVLLSNNAQYNPFVSMIFPDLIVADGAWHTLQVAVNLLPTTPPRWNITAIDINQENFSIKMVPGFFTGPYGKNLGTTQVPPPSFNVPMISTGLAGSDKFVLWLGQPVKSATAKYAPQEGFPGNYLMTTPAKFTQTVLAFPKSDVNLGAVVSQFVSVKSPTQGLLSSLSNTSLSAASIEETVNQIANGNSNNTSTFTAVSAQMAQLSSSMTATVTAATQAGANVSVMSSLAGARNSVSLASTDFAAQNPAGMAQSLSSVQQYLADAAAGAGSNGGGIATSIPSTPATVSVGGSAPVVYMSGNNATTTNVATGSVVAGSSGSYYQNQVDGGISLSNPAPSTYSTTTQPPDDSYMTIESIGTPPDVP